MEKLTVASSPHIRSSVTTRRIMLDVIIALMPSVIASSIIYGLRALLITAISVGSCVLAEFLWCRLLKKPVSVSDLSAVVTGILLAFNVPTGIRIWQMVVGAFITIIVVKELFGGIGCNFVNPALAGRVIMLLSFPESMTTYSVPLGYDTISGATPLSEISSYTMADFWEFFIGQKSGVLGEGCGLAILIGGIYLIARRVITITIPAVYIGGTYIFLLLFGYPNAFLSLFAGGLLLGAVFMATDYVTSPYNEWGKAVYALGCALITSVIRKFGNSAEGVSYSILFMNLLVPYINDLTRKKPLGVVKKK